MAATLLSKSIDYSRFKCSLLMTKLILGERNENTNTSSYISSIQKIRGQVVELPQDPDKALVPTEFIYFWRTSTGFYIEGGKVEIGVCTVRGRDLGILQKNG